MGSSSYRIRSHALVRPSRLAEVHEVLEKAENACIVAGGIDVIDQLKRGRQVDTVVSLANVPELATIEATQQTVRIAAAVTHWRLAMADAIDDSIWGFRHVWNQLGNVRVRAQGTVGGNIVSRMLASKSYDAVPLLHALSARAVVEQHDGTTVQVARVELDQLPDALTERAILSTIEIPCASNPRVTVSFRYKPAFSIAVAVTDVALRGVCWGGFPELVWVERHRAPHDVRDDDVQELANELADTAVAAAGLQRLSGWRDRIAHECARLLASVGVPLPGKAVV